MKHLKYPAPRALVRDLRACGDNYRKLAKLRNVNVYWIVRLFTYGEEPKTKATRLKLSLPGKKRKPYKARAPGPPLADHVRWWRGLSKEVRDEILRSEYAFYLGDAECFSPLGEIEADNDRSTLA